MLLESFLVFEAALQESVDSNQVALNILKLVCWNFLGVKDKHVSIKDILLDESAEVRPASAGDRVCRFRDDALICLHIVAESTQISSHFSVLDSAARLILEHKKIVMKFVLLLLHSSSRLHSTIKHFHEITWISCVGLVFVKVQQIVSDVLQIVLQNLAPLVSQAKLFKTFSIKSFQVDLSGTFRGLKSVEKLGFLSLVSCFDVCQVCCECLIIVEQQVRELLKAKIWVCVNLGCLCVQSSCLIKSRCQANLVQTVE